MVLDITATLETRQALARTIHAVAREIFLPLTVGGGIRSDEDADAAVEAGADHRRGVAGLVIHPEGGRVVIRGLEHLQYGVGRHARVVARADAQLLKRVGLTGHAGVDEKTEPQRTVVAHPRKREQQLGAAGRQPRRSAMQ